MAQIRLLAWNIQVYGKTKYEQTANNFRIIEFIAQVIAGLDVNMVLLMEIKDYLADEICLSIRNQLTAITNRGWRYYTVSTVLVGEYEDPAEGYGILWRTDARFDLTQQGPNWANIGLSENEFPSNVSARHGRRAAVATFRTADTGVNFTVSVYHAPPRPNQPTVVLSPHLKNSKYGEYQEAWHLLMKKV